MAKLVIKGHATRGKDVIETLEMLGGKNAFGHDGDDPLSVYYVDNSYRDYIICYYVYEDCDCVIFTLEEFLERFPYKVGDKVLINDDENDVYTVKSMVWNEDFKQVDYRIEAVDGIMNNHAWFAHEMEFTNHKKEETVVIEGKITMNEDKGTLVAIDLTREFKKADEVEVILGDYEFVLKNGKTYFVKRYKYPKTYEECCKVLMGKTNFQDFDLVLAKLTMNKNEDNTISPEPPYITSINNLYKLLICRDAYWKIAGEQMGLGKSWKPDWSDLSTTSHEFIKINNGRFTYSSRVLLFPTEEMCDAFYENFKDLIDKCKELL